MGKHVAQICLIIPAYNEELTIAKTLEAFDSITREITILIVDNSSRDKTYEIAANFKSKNRNSLLVVKEQSPGKANAFRKGLSLVAAECYVICDADNTYHAADFPLLVEAILKEGFDMAVADRHTSGDYARENKRKFHNLGNKLVSKIVNTLFKSELHDILSGYRAFSSNFIYSYSPTIAGFELETDLTIHALDKKLSIKEISSAYKDRPTGSNSKLNTYSDGYRILKLVVRLLRYYKPIPFFTFAASVEFFLSLVLGWPSISDYLEERYVTHVPSAILSTGLLLLSAFTFLIGVVIDSINQNDKKVSMNAYIHHNSN
jgi:glycosyltransferase involved in cell wall biosynthesis